MNSGWSNDEWNCSSCGILDGADSVVGKMMVRYRDTGKKNYLQRVDGYIIY